MQVINVYKPVGITPYQIVQQFKKVYPEFKNIKIGYAGRLDPMAEGVLILLIGDINKYKKKFEGLEKEYEFEAIFGFETDSYDLLGIVNLKTINNKVILEQKIINNIYTFKGDITQSYPPFSSVRVKGKPLFYWAFHNKLNEVIIPQKNVFISDIKLNSYKTISSEDLYQNIKKRINIVTGNFRQGEILDTWKLFFKQNTQKEFQIIKATLHCSSGTYVRSLVYDLATKLHSKATTVSIKRVSVGNYNIKESIDLFKENKE